MSYASGTSVSTERSQDEVKQLLRNRGADRFVLEESREQAAFGFELKGLRFVMSVPLPAKNDPQFWLTPKRRQKRSMREAMAAHDQEVRRRWRCLVAVVKAKLVAVDDEVSTFEQEFMPYVLMPNGRTLGQHVAPAIEAAMDRGDGVLRLTDQSRGEVQ